ncbi:MAG TPA: MFS transporter [Thermomicrobiaceae bacterium]|nr:MFS transporter [Thermomicrobiaceae bacterium]
MRDEAATATQAPAGGSPVRLGLIGALGIYPDYRLLWTSTVLTQAGQWMMQISLGWLMLQMTNSAGWVGLIGFASGVPFLAISIPAGVLIDRYDRRTVLVVCQAAAMAVSLVLAVMLTLHLATPWHLLAAAFLNSAALAVNTAARQVLIPNFVARDHLQNAVGLMSAGQNATRIVGPALAGPLIAGVGGAGAVYLQTVFLLAALAGTLMMPSVRASGAQVLAMRRNLVDGLAYIRRRPALAGLVWLAAIPTLLVFPYIQFLPVFARDILHIGAGGLGLLLTFSGIGAVTGALVVAGFEKMPRKGLFMLVGTIVYGLVVIAFAYSSWVVTSAAFIFGCGLLGSAYMSVNNSLLHLNVDDDMRGRVMGVYGLTWGLSPLGALPMGWIGDHVGVPSAVALGAVLSSLFTIGLALRSRQLRAL